MIRKQIAKRRNDRWTRVTFLLYHLPGSWLERFWLAGFEPPDWVVNHQQRNSSLQTSCWWLSFCWLISSKWILTTWQHLWQLQSETSCRSRCSASSLRFCSRAWVSCPNAVSTRIVIVIAVLIAHRHSPLDDLCSDWHLLLAAAVLDSLSITKPVHTTSIKKRMDSGVVGSVHQRVSQTSSLVSYLKWQNYLCRMGGLVLERAVGEFSGFVVFQPIINGIGGNLVSVQASKISTMLHQSSLPGIIPPHAKIFEMPWRALASGTPYAKSARILILMSIPGQVLFIFVADYIHMSGSTIGAPFILSYMLVSFIQVSRQLIHAQRDIETFFSSPKQVILLLYIAHVIIHAMWKFKIDPDTSSIPYLTALGDLFGSTLLLGSFAFLRFISHEYEGRSKTSVSEILPTPFDFLLTTFGGNWMLPDSLFIAH